MRSTAWRRDSTVHLNGRSSPLIVGAEIARLISLFDVGSQISDLSVRAFPRRPLGGFGEEDPSVRIGTSTASRHLAVFISTAAGAIAHSSRETTDSNRSKPAAR